jgi:flagellar hook-length control protein FliK
VFEPLVESATEELSRMPEPSQSNFSYVKQDADAQQFFTMQTEQTQTPHAAEKSTLPESSFDDRVRQAQDAQAIAQQMVKAASFRQGIAFSELTLSLKPEYLGNLRMNVSIENDVVFAKITTDSAYARDVMSNNMPMLREALDSVGIQVEDIRVTFEEGGMDFTQSDNSNLQQDTQPERNNVFEEGADIPAIIEYENAAASTQTEVQHTNELPIDRRINVLV